MKVIERWGQQVFDQAGIGKISLLKIRKKKVLMRTQIPTKNRYKVAKEGQSSYQNRVWQPLLKIWWLPPGHFYTLFTSPLIPARKVSKKRFSVYFGQSYYGQFGLFCVDCYLYLVWTYHHILKSKALKFIFFKLAWISNWWGNEARRIPGGADHFRPLTQTLRHHEGARDAGYHLQSNSFQTDRENTFIPQAGFLRPSY